MESQKNTPENRIKEEHCLNCKAVLTDRFCQHCGQDSREFKRSVWAISFQFFETFTDFDNKLWSSLGPLIYRPGYLTKQFLLGKRKSYLNPIQMYAFFSFIFFLTAFYLPDFNDKDGKNSLAHALKSVNFNTKDTAREDSVTRITLGAGGSSLNLKSTRKKQKNAIELDGDSTTLASYDSTQNDLPEEERDNFFKRSLYRKGLATVEKMNRGEKNVFAGYIDAFKGNIPNVVILLLPIFALILKLLYIRRKFYYVEHLIFAIHIHCFAFLLFSIVILISSTVPGMDDWTDLLLLVLVLYVFVAMKNMYAQGWFRTFFKYLFLAWGYLLFVVIGLVLNLLVSALLVEV